MKTVMKAASVAGLVAVIVFTAALPAYAATNHANPDTAEQIFSGISLLRYYSASLDFVLQRNPTKTATYLEKMPFANVTAPLKEVTAAFAQHTVTVSNSVSGIYKLWNAQRTLAQQGRVNEAGTLAGVITDSIAEARDEISSLEQSVMATDLELHTPEAPANSALRLTDNQIWDKISRIRSMLNLVEAGLRESSAGAPARESRALTVEPLRVPRSTESG